MFLRIVLSSCVPTLLNIYQALKDLICLRLCLFSKVLYGAVFLVRGPVSQWSRLYIYIYGAGSGPAQSLHRWRSCQHIVCCSEEDLAMQRPQADRLLRHQGMAHMKTLTNIV